MKLATLGVLFAATGIIAAPLEKKDIDKVSFMMKACSPGNSVDGYVINKVDSHPHVFSVGGNEGCSVLLSIQDDTSMKDSSLRGVYIDPNTGEFGNVDPWGQEAATTGFCKDNGYLLYNGNCDFYACPSGENKYSLVVKEGCTGGQKLKLKYEDVKLV